MNEIEEGDLVIQKYTKRMYIVLKVMVDHGVPVARLVDFNGTKALFACHKLIKINKNT